MEVFLKVTVGVLIAAIICLTLTQYGADFALLISLCVCTMIICGAASYLQPVIAFVSRLTEIGELDSEVLTILLRVVGISVITQITANICTDAGRQSLGKALQIISTAASLCICLPLLEQILSLIEMILGEA